MQEIPLHIRPYQAEDEEQVIGLWGSCDLLRPYNDPHEEIRRKLAVQPEWFLVGLRDDRVVATVMAGYDGHRGWLNYVAVSPDVQGQGIGRTMIESAIAALEAGGCPKVNLQIRTSNQAVISFYESLGFVVEDLVSMGKRF